MKKSRCIAANKRQLNSLTRDYREDGWFIITYTETFRELERGDEILVIELNQ